MGTFDMVEFAEPLPKFPVEIDLDQTPQTKDLNWMPYMNTYVVRDGKLYQRHSKYEGTGEFEEPFMGIAREKQRLVDEWETPVLYHGDIGLACCGKGSPRSYVYLMARFTEGELQWIKTEEDYEEEYGL